MAVADGFHVDSSGNLWLGSNNTTFTNTTKSEAKFYVEADGTMVAKAGASFAGDLSAAGGTFSGDISGASGTFTGNLSGSTITGGSINIGNGTFQVDSSGNLTATSASISGVISAGGAAADINNNSTQIDGGKIVANSVTVAEANISGQLSFGKLSIESADIISTIAAGAITNDKIDTISATKISAGTLAGMTLTGASITALTLDAGQIDITGGASNALDVTGGIEASGVVKGSTFQASSGSSSIGFSSSSVFIRGGGTTNLTLGSSNKSHGHWAPSFNNVYDLGTDSLRWDDVKATNGTIQTSDITLKDNIVTTDLGLDFINDLTPIEYTWTAFGGDEDNPSVAGTRTHLGFSAQDIKEKLITHKGSDQNIAIYTESQYDDDFDEENDTNQFGLRPTELIPILVKSIQELTARIEELEA